MTQDCNDPLHASDQPEEWSDRGRLFQRLQRLFHLRSRTTDYVVLRLLDELASKRHPVRVTDKLLEALSIRFALNPAAEVHLHKMIQAWRAIRIL